RASTRGREVMATTARLDLAAADLLDRGAETPLPWVASVKTHLSHFPLQSVTALDTRQITGKASGDFAIANWHQDAKATLAIDLEGLRVGDVACKAAALRGSADGHAIDASARIEQEDGSATLVTHAGAHWGAALVPAIDVSQAAAATFTA